MNTCLVSEVLHMPLKLTRRNITNQFADIPGIVHHAPHGANVLSDIRIAYGPFTLVHHNHDISTDEPGPCREHLRHKDLSTDTCDLTHQGTDVTLFRSRAVSSVG